MYVNLPLPPLPRSLTHSHFTSYLLSLAKLDMFSTPRPHYPASRQGVFKDQTVGASSSSKSSLASVRNAHWQLPPTPPLSTSPGSAESYDSYFPPQSPSASPSLASMAQLQASSRSGKLSGHYVPSPLSPSSSTYHSGAFTGPVSSPTVTSSPAFQLLRNTRGTITQSNSAPMRIDNTPTEYVLAVRVSSLSLSRSPFSSSLPSPPLPPFTITFLSPYRPFGALRDRNSRIFFPPFPILPFFDPPSPPLPFFSPSHCYSFTPNHSRLFRPFFLSFIALFLSLSASPSLYSFFFGKKNSLSLCSPI